MNQLDTFASLRPDVDIIDPADRATIRRDIFGGGIETEPHHETQITTGRPPSRRPRWLPAAAAAALLVIGAAVVWMATGSGSGDSPDYASTSPSTDGSPISSPTADRSAWYQTVTSLLPAGFDHVAVLPGNGGVVSVLAAQPTTGLVLEVTLDERTASDHGAADSEQAGDEAESFRDGFDRTTLTTGDGRIIVVRCGVSIKDGFTRTNPVSGLAESNDVCGAVGGPTVDEWRAVASGFATAGKRGDLVALADVADTAEAATDPASPMVIALVGELGDHAITSSDASGRREEIELPSVPGGELTTEIGVVHGVAPADNGDLQVHRMVIPDGSAKSGVAPADGSADCEIAIVSLVRDGHLYQAATSDLSDSHLAALTSLLSEVAEPSGSTATSAPERLAIGDTVLASAREGLETEGWRVFAVPSLQTKDFPPIASRLAGGGLGGDLVLVQVGTNGPMTQEQIDAVLAPLADAELVLLYNVHGDLGWRDANNELLAAVAAAYPNVQLIDWNGLAASCPGDCFFGDGIHLKPDGIAYFEQLATDAWTNR